MSEQVVCIACMYVLNVFLKFEVSK